MARASSGTVLAALELAAGVLCIAEEANAEGRKGLCLKGNGFVGASWDVDELRRAMRRKRDRRQVGRRNFGRRALLVEISVSVP